MTYWPISSPSVFAATKETRPERLHASHDGAEPGTGQGGADDQTESSVADSEEQAESEPSETGARTIEDRPVEQQLKHKEHEQLAEDDISGNIVAIKVTRSGHMLATITRSTLTIWQTKACLSAQAAILLLMYA